MTTTSPPIYSISIAVHNQVEYTKRCINSIMKNSSDFEILIHDNASTDDTKNYLKRLQSKHSNVRVFRFAFNTGFLTAHNNAVAQAWGEWIVLLNNDFEVGHGWLEAMRKKFNDIPSLGLCGVTDTFMALNSDGIGFKSNGNPDYVEASCLMIPRRILSEMQLFDPKFRFAYCEDADLSLRLREKGYTISHAKFEHVHHHAVTNKAVSLMGTVDLEGYELYNRALLRSRWKHYLENRNFIHRIAVKRLGSMGDVLMMTPALRALKRKWGHARITVITHHRSVLIGNPYISATITNENFRPDRYDHVYDLDLSYERRPMEHPISVYADICGVDVSRDSCPGIYPQLEARRFAEKYVDRSWAVIHPGPSSWPGRNWGHAKFVAVASWLRQNSWKVIIVGTGSTHTLPCDLDMRGKTDVQKLAAVVGRCGLFVGIDSLVMHIAQAQLVPTVAVFGCIDPKLRLIDHPLIAGVTADNLGCLGCHHVAPAPAVESHCLRSEVLCMDKLDVEKVIQTIKTVVGKRRDINENMESHSEVKT